ncbi:MAG: hypothetical protein R3F59_38600, partial [Myxococcota bacterium]
FDGMPSAMGLDGNVDYTPWFVDRDHGDYHLRSTSPVIDLGDPSILDPDGTRSDMGRYGGPAGG